VEFRTPDGAASPAQQSQLEALATRTLTARIRRFEMALGAPEGGEFGWRRHLGDEFVFELNLDVERPFVLRAPAGRYDFTAIDTGADSTCKLDGIGTFTIEPGHTTYVGKLVVQVGFRSADGLAQRKTAEQLNSVWILGMEERWLDMQVVVLDRSAAWPEATARVDLIEPGRASWTYTASSSGQTQPTIYGR
jgi:hypothetical protein